MGSRKRGHAAVSHFFHAPRARRSAFEGRSRVEIEWEEIIHFWSFSTSHREWVPAALWDIVTSWDVVTLRCFPSFSTRQPPQFSFSCVCSICPLFFANSTHLLCAAGDFVYLNFWLLWNVATLLCSDQFFTLLRSDQNLSHNVVP